MNDFALFDFRLRVDKDAIDGKNRLLVEYRDSVDVACSEAELSLEVESDKVDFEIADIDSVPLRLKPGDKDTKITVEIQNIGDGDAECVKSRLTLPAGFNASDSYSDIANLGTVAADASSQADGGRNGAYNDCRVHTGLCCGVTLLQVSTCRAHRDHSNRSGTRLDDQHDATP